MNMLPAIRHELAQRIAMLEATLAPPPCICWVPWRTVLSEGEYGLVMVLAQAALDLVLAALRDTTPNLRTLRALLV